MPSELLAHDEQDLGVRLEADEAVDDVRARLLQHAGPFDVRLLVEARFELDERDDLLARFRGLHERRTMPASSPPVRYIVCLIASTAGSLAAWSTNASMVVLNESYGMVEQHVAGAASPTARRVRRPRARAASAA